MRIGIHTSSSPRLQSAALKALELGANCFQIFSASPRMWRAAPPPPEEAEAMKRLRAEHDLRPLVIHDSYLINLASGDETIRAKSIAAFRAELERAFLIGAEYLVIHPGSHKDRTLEEGILAIADALQEASAKLAPPPTFSLLLENTAGAGNTIGRTLEELKQIHELAAPRVPYPIGYCLDTCHLYASGFDVASEAGLRDTVKLAEAVLGLDHVPVIHTNDSKGALASKLDRHANIGEGQIGLDGFRRILNHPKLRSKAFVLETPIDEPGDDLRNVNALKALCPKSRITTKKSS
ncbi:MAG: deoxyribonuclease IV [Bryobacteraceae bacterium]|nr:deoxyribonuclease IV [Bryobacteraceae bacterium]